MPTCQRTGVSGAVDKVKGLASSRQREMSRDVTPMIKEKMLPGYPVYAVQLLERMIA